MLMTGRPVSIDRWPVLAAVPRARVFAWVAVVTVVNALATPILASIRIDGLPIALLDLFGVSAVIWFSLFAIGRLSADDEQDVPPIGRRDAVVLAVLVACSFVPISMVSAAAVFFGGAYCVATNRTGSATFRIGVVLVALSFSLLWGRVLLVALGPQLLSFDAGFVGWMAGTRSAGNLVYFAGSSEPFVVGVYCSSLHNVSLGALLWTSVSQMLRIAVDRQWTVTCAGVALSVFLINALRLTAIAWYPEHFVTLHVGTLAQLFGASGLIASVLVILWGVRASARAGV